jgi:23S rRNA pseudouridine1911/1915/1917 synthase
MAVPEHSTIQWNYVIPENSGRADLFILHQIQSGEGKWVGGPVELTRSQLKRLMETGCALCDSKEIQPSDKLKKGGVFVLHIPAPEPTELVPEDRPLDVLFEDEHLIVINKPAGLTVHPSSTQKQGTLVHALLFQVQNLSGIGGVLRPGIVHRLDKDTSGALVVTKTDQAHSRLAETFSRHEIDRVYWALCYGAPASGRKRVTIESLIGRDESDRKKMSMTVQHGRKAVTHLKVLESYAQASKNPFASWVEVTLETGRTHQIRVHLTGHGNSILGDPVYGKPTARHTKFLALPASLRSQVNELSGQMLHARVLGFTHPVTGKKLFFEAAPPTDFQKMLKELQGFQEGR